MTPSITLLLGGAVAACVAVGAAWFHGKGVGWDQREAQALQDERAAREEADKRVDRVRTEGLEQSQRYEDKLRDIEGRYARTNRTLREALAQPVKCPASGAVGDIVVPAGVVAGMFNREAPAASASAPGPSASEPAGRVR